VEEFEFSAKNYGKQVSKFIKQVEQMTPEMWVKLNARADAVALSTASVGSDSSDEEVTYDF
jgi:hypothetical protein